MFYIYCFGIILLILIIIYHNSWQTNIWTRPETFDPRADNPDYNSGPMTNLLWVGKKANDCYLLNSRQCLKYSNCGLCVTKNNGKVNKQCVPGDDSGPMFTGKCDMWEYMDYYDGHIFGDKEHRLVHPWGKVYPDYEVWAPSPVSRIGAL